MVEILLRDGSRVDAVRLNEPGGMDVWLTEDGARIPTGCAQLVYTLKETAQLLGATYAQVAGWVRSGRLDAIQLSGFFWRVPQAAIERFVRPRRGRPPLARDERGEASGGQVIVAFLALLFVIGAAILFGWIELPVDLLWLFRQFGQGW